MLEPSVIERFRQVIMAHTGLVIPAHDTPFLHETLSHRLQVHMRATHAKTTRDDLIETYLKILTTEGRDSETEWQELVLTLTTGESYFFRDAGQMALLRDVLLPELIHFRQPERRLRVWSAGCSTGEEPYSLAIMLQELLPATVPAWRLMLKGSDINAHALQRAKRACYSRWAFRGVSDDMVARYFRRTQDHWSVRPEIQQMVQFEKFNLIKDIFPNPDRQLQDLDLILCRNVFIYFNNETIAGIMARFVASLRPGGYIVTGHAEIQTPVFHLVQSGNLPLLVRQFPASIVFQRPMDGDPLLDRHATPIRSHLMPLTQHDTDRPCPPLSTQGGPPSTHKKQRGTVAPPSAAMPAVRTTRPPSVPRQDEAASPPSPHHAPVATHMEKARRLFAQGQYHEAMTLVTPLRDVDGVAFEAVLILAHIHANRGETTQADAYCQEALKHQPCATEPHFLMATMAHEAGDTELAKTLLNKTLYLDRSHVAAYLQLATIHEESGTMERARHMRLAALDVLRHTPATDRIAYYEEWTVERLTARLQQLVDLSPLPAPR